MLTGRLTQRQTNSFLFDSVAQVYGDGAIAAFALALQPDSSVGLFAYVLNVASIDQASIDWRDLLTWRLALEGELIARGDQTGFLSLYDPAIADVASSRYFSGETADGWVVTALTQEADALGRSTLRAAVVRGDEQSMIVFSLVDGVWKRAS